MLGTESVFLSQAVESAEILISIRETDFMDINKLLIVDDEQLITDFLERQLSKLGYTVFTAADGKKAIKSTLENNPDLIFLDVKMPRLDGIEACKKLKKDKRTKDIPIIVLSAKAQFHEIQEGLDAGADKYLTKPFGFPEIVKLIESYKNDEED